MDKKMTAVIVMLPLLLNACATGTKSALLGGAIGGVAGGVVGQNQSQNTQGAAVGALVGAGIGSFIGYLAYKDKQKKDIKKPEATAEELEPFLTKPRIRSYIVPDTIEGNKYIKSHKVFILEDPGSWSKD